MGSEMCIRDRSLKSAMKSKFIVNKIVTLEKCQETDWLFRRYWKLEKTEKSENQNPRLVYYKNILPFHQAMELTVTQRHTQKS